MTDRVNGLTVVLERNMRTDDVESLVQAIANFRFVRSVQPIIVESSAHVAEMRLRSELAERVRDLALNILNDAR